MLLGKFLKYCLAKRLAFYCITVKVDFFVDNAKWQFSKWDNNNSESNRFPEASNPSAADNFFVDNNSQVQTVTKKRICFAFSSHDKCRIIFAMQQTAVIVEFLVYRAPNLN